MEDRIFFKDNTAALKGPYTERQVQEWYRQKWFESSFPFYFTQSDEPPSDLESSGITLDSLRSRNGIGCPFKKFNEKEKSEYETKRDETERRLEKIQKDIADLRQKCTAVLNLEKRIEGAEKAVEELATAAATAASAADKSVQQEDIKHAELANKWAAYCVDALKSYATGEMKKDNPISDAMMAVLDSESGRQKCQDVVLKALKELDYVFCVECDVVLQNYKQILLHIMEPKHNDQRSCDKWRVWQRTANSMLAKIAGPVLKRVVDAEKKIAEEEKTKRVDVNRFRRTPQLRPTIPFHDSFGASHSYLLANSGTTDVERLATMMRRLKQDRTAHKSMAKLHDHLGDSVTYCCTCVFVAGKREDYYKHFRTHDHLMKTDAFDLPTLVVNMCKKEEE